MPATFPAHQGLVVGAKLRWPTRIDGTALCIGAAAPDIAYAMGHWLNRESHTLLGLFVWSLPLTVLACALTRWRAASGIFAHLPDLGPFRLRSYRVLGQARPSAIVTITSSLLGAGSHIVIDLFTHRTRWGAEHLGLDRVVALPAGHHASIAYLLQYAGHVGGSIAFAGFVFVIARRHLLEAWYGAAAVDDARRVRPLVRQRILFWTILVVPTLVAVRIVARTDASHFLPLTVLFASTLIAGVVVPTPAWSEA